MTIPIKSRTESDRISRKFIFYRKGSSNPCRIFPMEYKREPKVKQALNINLFYVLLVLLIQGCGSVTVKDTVRADYIRAENKLPVWSSLTDFETEVITQAKNQTARGIFEHETWLELAVVLGGEIRTERSAKPLVDVYNNFIEKVEPEVSRASTDMVKGEILLSRFHDYFLGGEQYSMDNYDLNQSRPDLLLETGIFNCASSAILFGLAAEYFGFHVQGVILPHHIFLQLTSPGFGDKLIEVETTSGDGFNWSHDRAYFKEQDKKWATDRGLVPNTYKDYLDRRIISFQSVILV